MSALIATPLLRQRGPLRAAMACAVMAALCAVGLLGVAGWFLAGAALAGLAGPLAVTGFNYLLPSAALRAAAIVRTASRYGERMLGHRAALFALAEVRATLFARVAQAALAGRDAGRSGAMAARFGRDVDLLEDAAIRRVARVGAWSAAAVALGLALPLGWAAVLALALGMAAMRLAARTMARRLLPGAQQDLAAAHAALAADYAEMAGPAADIAVYGLAPALAQALAERAEAQSRAQAALARAEAWLTATQTLLAGLTLAGLVTLAQAPAPLLALGLLAALAALEPWSGLAAHDARGPEMRLALARLDQAGEVPPLAPSPALASLSGRPVLTIAGQAFAHGARVLITGPSGAGKTRLLETLAGLRQDAPQMLAIDGHDPRALGLAALRPHLALMPQSAPLIAGTVADNLALARPGLTRAAMERALYVACAEDVVAALPQGLDQWLGGDGARLSGGQRRRLVLARALLAGRPWLLLDEPSEGLDLATEARLRERLDAWLDQTGTGLLLVSHRPALAALAQQVVPIA
ncbi:ATP-binding cassette domain-containing protein [Sphingomonas sp. R3G8C]|uniref:ATP-binding cassette domain-containing protein n=1 Tax=Novosphingobium rhizosphaerae TaxID=1551649 RepID=UPI0015C9FA25